MVGGAFGGRFNNGPTVRSLLSCAASEDFGEPGLAGAGGEISILLLPGTGGAAWLYLEVDGAAVVGENDDIGGQGWGAKR